MMFHRRSVNKSATAPPKHSTSLRRSVSYSASLSLPAPSWTPSSAKRRPLETQHLGLAALDAGYCCHEFTKLHLKVECRLDRHVVGGVLENATGQTLFKVREKPLSLHRQRMLVDTTEMPVATLRTSAFRRHKATYSSFLRTKMSKTPVFKFTMTHSKLEMIFSDIMTSETCRLGSNGEQDDTEIWLQRGLFANTVRQPIAHMYPAPPGSSMGYSLDIAEGVDAVMIILVCIAIHDSKSDCMWRTSSNFVWSPAI
ncbi:unnamed protein product [Peronospora farinosa]|uniref:Uncharacterized protein n=1 Tax=Peronospora farinosa TaxID=134698 RepID=A0AAV0UE02_9STRA|nr:unnamed protein product [Peronospora farinosa]CAI5735242.1 unnamed protein product [Peronospora farinosa]